MAPAFLALPELLRRPWIAWPWVFEFHLGATALATDLNLDVAHARDSSVSSQSVATRCPDEWVGTYLVYELGFQMGHAGGTLRRS